MRKENQVDVGLKKGELTNEKGKLKG
ncbi:hypothetical protein BSG1_06017 [Bacillus sp. SG-1]|nr:hypothetical protein BSG1_06017 [Bacillus sp. SG-1]